MAKTLGSTTDQLLDELDRTGQLTSQAHTYLDEAINHYKDDAFRFNEEVTSFPTVASNEYLDLPINYGEHYTISIDNQGDGEYLPLTRLTMGEMDEKYSTQTGRPSFYTIFQEQIRLCSIPDVSTHIIKMTYRVRPATATAATQTNIFYENANSLIRCRAGMLIAKFILKDDEVSQRFSGEEMTALAKLRGLTSTYQSTGRARARR